MWGPLSISPTTCLLYKGLNSKGDEISLRRFWGVVSANAVRPGLHVMQRGHGMMHRADNQAEAPDEILRRKSRDVAANGLAKFDQDWLEFGGENFRGEWQRLDKYPPKQTSAGGIVRGSVVTNLI